MRKNFGHYPNLTFDKNISASHEHNIISATVFQIISAAAIGLEVISLPTNIKAPSSYIVNSGIETIGRVMWVQTFATVG